MEIERLRALKEHKGKEKQHQRQTQRSKGAGAAMRLLLKSSSEFSMVKNMSKRLRHCCATWRDCRRKTFNRYKRKERHGEL